jgi:hypothetical protein
MVEFGLEWFSSLAERCVDVVLGENDFQLIFMLHSPDKIVKKLVKLVPVLPAVRMQEPLGLLHYRAGERSSICLLQHDGSYCKELFRKSLVVRASCDRDALHVVSSIDKHD